MKGTKFSNFIGKMFGSDKNLKKMSKPFTSRNTSGKFFVRNLTRPEITDLYASTFTITTKLL